MAIRDTVVSVAVIGVGYWGPNLVRNLANLPECHVRWVCDRKLGRLQLMKQRYPQIRVTEDANRVLEDPSVDAVMIATPVSTHAKLALAAIRAGKHLFIEKPLALTSREAEEIVTAADQAKRVLAVGHVFVFNPAVDRMNKMIRNGEIGELCYAESSRVNLGPPASEVDVIWDLAVHDVSIVWSIWHELPVEVVAFGGRYVHPTLIDVAFLNLRFSNGSMASHHVSWLSPEKVRRFFVAGTKGSLIFDDTASPKLRVFDKGVDSRIGLTEDDVRELYYKPGEIIVPELANDEPLSLECMHFLDCVREGARPRADGSAGLAVVKVLEAAKRSLAQGSTPVPLS